MSNTFTDEEIEAIKAQARAEALSQMPLTPTEGPPRVPPAPVQEIVQRLKIDTSKLTIGDQETLLRIGVASQNADSTSLAVQADAIALLERIVVGGVRHLPLSDLPDVMQQVGQALGKVGDRQGN